jgi:hypothetical protein
MGYPRFYASLFADDEYVSFVLQQWYLAAEAGHLWSCVVVDSRLYLSTPKGLYQGFIGDKTVFARKLQEVRTHCRIKYLFD